MWQRFSIWACCASLLAACEQQEPPPALEPPPVTTADAGSSWRTLDGSDGAAVAAEANDPILAEAIDRARATAEQARRRWQADPAGGDTWSIKWAAPTAGGGVEHVWVRPLSWSRFRIEGRLASPPQARLLCGRKAGELVSFPAEELSDWLHLLDGTTDGRREGGFTIDLLEQRHGRP
ncbi:MAG: DUF2314 domain-containing protein [Planctomycetota bacterium]|jgi:uncharacterized protein YegJ (DUF2314 family)